MEFTKRQRQIIDEAVSIIAWQGIQKLTTKNLAARIGISEAALYRHFDSKYELLSAILDLFKMVSEYESDETGIEFIKGFFHDRLKKFSANPELARVMFSEEIFHYNQELSLKLLSIMDRHGELLKNAVKDAKSKAEIRRDTEISSILMVVIGSLRHIVTRWCLSDYNFDLKVEGTKLWNDLEKILR